MILKFGLLILLLVQDRTFAAKRQPSLSNVEAADAMQILKQRSLSDIEAAFVGQMLKQLHIRSLQMPHSKVRNPPSNESARLVSLSEEDCAWDSRSDRCSLSLHKMRKLLKKSDTGFAKILAERLDCLEQTEGSQCSKRMRCLWDEEERECQYVDIRRGHEDSPCAKAVPHLFDYLEASVLCGKRDSKRSCKAKRQCFWWASDIFSCLPDFGSIFFGVKFSDKGRKIGKVFHSIHDAVETEYTALQSADNFTWQSLFDYKPRGIDCPSDIEPVVCEVIVAYWSALLPLKILCHGKYQSASDCNADASCVWNRYPAECQTDDEAESNAVSEALLRVFAASLPEGTEKRLLEVFFACESVVEERSCYGIISTMPHLCLAVFFSAGKCVWDPTDNVCAVNYLYLVAVLTEPGKDSADGLCKYLAVKGFSACLFRSTKTECQRTEICGWKDGSCEPTEEYYVSKAAELDSALMEKYFQVKWRCCGGNGTIQLTENRIRKTIV